MTKWLAKKKEADNYILRSPPGFDEQLEGEQSDKNNNTENKSKYALFLYPDNLSLYWIIFFIVTVILPLLLNFILSGIEKVIPCLQINVAEISSRNIYWSAIALFFFPAAYHLIYFCFRRPILDDLWKEWPQTPNQKKQFQNVPSKITFCSKEHCDKYQEVYPAVGSKKKNFVQWVAGVWQRDCCCKKSLSASYFHRPVFYSPGRSLQEVLLRTGIASLFARGHRKEKKSIWNLGAFSIYYFAHIWVSYLWLLIQLLYIFISGTRPEDSTMLHFVFPIIIWAILTFFSLVYQFRFMNSSLVQYDPELFLLTPPNLKPIIESKMRANRNTMQYLPTLLSIVGALTITVYLALVNLTMQAEVPSEKVLQCKGTSSNYSLSFEIKKR